MKIDKIYDFLDICYEFQRQEVYDESGLVKFGEFDINKIVVCLEINNAIIDYAINNGVKLIVSHHPLLAKSLEDQFSPNHKIVKRLSNNKISIISIHTPFDKSVIGMNVSLAQKLQLVDIKRLKNNDYVVYGKLLKPLKFSRLATKAKEQLDSDYVKYIDIYKNSMISTVAICGGSGGSMITDVSSNKKIDAYITCDMKHHLWSDSYELNLPVIDLNHDIESIFIDIISKKLRELEPKLEILKYRYRVNLVIE